MLGGRAEPAVTQQSLTLLWGQRGQGLVQRTAPLRSRPAGKGQVRSSGSEEGEYGGEVRPAEAPSSRSGEGRRGNAIVKESD